MEDNAKELRKLILENPDVPIVPMVPEVESDEDGTYWLGSIEKSEVSEYALYNDRFYVDREEFKEYYYYNNDDDLCETFGYNPYINQYSVKIGRYTQTELNANNQKLAELDCYLEKVADAYFTKAIIVYIGVK